MNNFPFPFLGFPRERIWKANSCYLGRNLCAFERTNKKERIITIREGRRLYRERERKLREKGRMNDSNL